jgi:hypothetical protein
VCVCVCLGGGHGLRINWAHDLEFVGEICIQSL